MAMPEEYTVSFSVYHIRRYMVYLISLRMFSIKVTCARPFYFIFTILPFKLKYMLREMLQGYENILLHTIILAFIGKFRLHFHFSLSCTGEGNGNPLQYSCLENPRDRGAYRAAVYGVAQSRTRLKQLSSSSSSSKCYCDVYMMVILFFNYFPYLLLYSRPYVPY